MNWIKIQDGILALEGTPMQIRYQSGACGEYRIYQGGRYRWPCTTLACAKLEAQDIYMELAEIGVA